MTKNSDLWTELNSRLEAELNTGTRLLNTKRLMKGLSGPQIIDESEKPMIITHIAGISYEILDNVFFAEKMTLSVIICANTCVNTDYIKELLDIRDGVLNTLETTSAGVADLTVNGKALREWNFKTDPIKLTDGGKSAMLETKVLIDSIQFQAGGR